MKNKYIFNREPSQMAMLRRMLFGVLFFLIASATQGQVCTQTNVFNLNGGTNATNGLELYMTAAGNIQIRKDNFYQIYISPLTSSSTPYQTPGLHGLCLSVGNTVFKSGTILPTGMTDGGFLEVVSTTCPADLEAAGSGSYKNVIVLKATVGGLDYFLTLTYAYVSFNKFINIDYKVTIPAGNTSPVRLSHGFDTYLNGGDAGPGFINGTAPYYIMGVTKAGGYEAFNYVSGLPWSGYYSAVYNGVFTDLGTDNTYNNTIDPSPDTDNGIGISMDFGSTAGIYSSNSNLIFECNAPSTAPVLSATSAANTCPVASVNLNALVSSTVPAGVELLWRKVGDNTVVATPTTLTESGQYYVVFKDMATGCSSPVSTNVTVTITPCCNAGTTAPTLSATTKANTCPATTVDLTTITASNNPANTTLTWHTGTPATATNKITGTAVLAGTYYAAIFDGTNLCYSPTTTVTASVTGCCNAGTVAPVLIKTVLAN